ncbi:urease subunit gamma [Streptomyces sp. NRRL S-1868]|uniref:urease subunit gamma n=1 Tax=Streptomyces sp. NRRL S-1868 TaxID=1463892 RepID=UPI00099D15B4|nr:urease subunit gamma [Streptomyces sp. NRRL S-1868]
MRLNPTERDRLLIFGVAELARARRARGLRLNVPEATALIADAVCEAARDGARLAEAIEAGRRVLGPDEVLPGVADVVGEVQVEAVFEDGSRLAVVTDPIARAGGPDDGTGRKPEQEQEREPGPGAVLPAADAAAVAAQYALPEPEVTVRVRNTATVPVSVTSHFHFFEANPRLDFDRAAGYGMRPAVPAGSSVRFDPGEEAEVGLVPIGGARIAIGFAGLVDGPLDASGARAEALRRAAACGYLGAVPPEVDGAPETDGAREADGAPASADAAPDPGAADGASGPAAGGEEGARGSSPAPGKESR